MYASNIMRPHQWPQFNFIVQVADLSEECGTLREKTSVLESDLARETDLRSGAEKLANEVQSSLTKESERAQDLKV